MFLLFLVPLGLHLGFLDFCCFFSYLIPSFIYISYTVPSFLANITINHLVSIFLLKKRPDPGVRLLLSVTPLAVSFLDFSPLKNQTYFSFTFHTLTMSESYDCVIVGAGKLFFPTSFTFMCSAALPLLLLRDLCHTTAPRCSLHSPLKRLPSHPCCWHAA